VAADQARAARIRLLTDAAHAYKQATGVTVATDELGELHACELLGLSPAVTNNPGFDATETDGTRVQVKARAPRSGAQVNPAGRMSRFQNWEFDYALLVLLDGDCVPETIVRRERADVQRMQDRLPNSAQGLHVSTFVRGGIVVWRRI
jgi:hypothetical protein